MLKFIFLGLALVASANAGEHKINISSSRIYENTVNPAVTILQIKDDSPGDKKTSTTKPKTIFTWNMNMDSNQNPMRATVTVWNKDIKKEMKVTFKDVCEKTEEKSHKRSVQKFILKVIANQENCPIKKGANSSVPMPFIDTYTANDKCGSINVVLKLFDKNEKRDWKDIFTGLFMGNITGC